MKTILYFPPYIALKPISDYLHPGLWTIGNDIETQDEDYSDITLLELTLTKLSQYGLSNFSIIGETQLNQLIAICRHLERQLDIYIKIIQTKNLPVLEQLLLLSNEDMLFYPGLFFTNADILDFLEANAMHDKISTLLISRGYQYKVGIAQINSLDTITKFEEKPFDKFTYSYTGIFILKRGWQVLLKLYLQQISVKLPRNTNGTFTSFLKYLIRDKEVKVHTITESKSPSFLDFSELENWIKVNATEIIENILQIDE